MTFLSERKVLKMILNGKVEVLSTWDHEIAWANGSFKMPAVIKMSYKNRWLPKIAKFNRKAVLKRDYYICQYCGYAGTPKQLTVDHIIPSSKGGLNTFSNCVTSCRTCNEKKGDKTPEQAGMKLLNKPEAPKRFIIHEYRSFSKVHHDWKFYLGL
jgi:hypothetical protein